MSIPIPIIPLPLPGSIIFPNAAKDTFDNAKRRGELAESNYKKAECVLDENRNVTQQALEQLGKLKTEVFTHQIKHLVSVVQQKEKMRMELAGYDEKLEIKKNFGIGPFVAVELSSSINSYGLVDPEKFWQAISGSIKYDSEVKAAIAQMDAINKAMEDIRTAVAGQTAVIMTLAEEFEAAKVDSIDDPGADKMLMIGQSLMEVLTEHVLDNYITVNSHISSQYSGSLEIC